jgi:hypothetical protein
MSGAGIHEHIESEYDQFNPYCPKCGKKALVGLITAVFSRVPLDADGWDLTLGRGEESEVLLVECKECDYQGDASSYYNTEKEEL